MAERRHKETIVYDVTHEQTIDYHLAMMDRQVLGSNRRIILLFREADLPKYQQNEKYTKFLLELKKKGNVIEERIRIGIKEYITIESSMQLPAINLDSNTTNLRLHIHNEACTDCQVPYFKPLLKNLPDNLARLTLFLDNFDANLFKNLGQALRNKLHIPEIIIKIESVNQKIINITITIKNGIIYIAGTQENDTSKDSEHRILVAVKAIEKLALPINNIQLPLVSEKIFKLLIEKNRYVSSIEIKAFDLHREYFRFEEFLDLLKNNPNIINIAFTGDFIPTDFKKERHQLELSPALQQLDENRRTLPGRKMLTLACAQERCKKKKEPFLPPELIRKVAFFGELINEDSELYSQAGSLSPSSST